MTRGRGSGGKSSGAFARWDQTSSSWRTSAPSSSEGSTGSPPTWPRAGIASRGVASALPMLAPPTDASGSSSSLLPTMLASDGRTKGSSSGHGDSMARLARNLPTPVVPDWRGPQGGRRKTVDTLPDVVAKLLPTCVTSDANGPQKGPARQGGPSLANLLPTATVADSRGTRRVGLAPGSNPGTTLSDVIWESSLATAGTFPSSILEAILALNAAGSEPVTLPTPQARDGKGKTGGVEDRHSNLNNLLPTPISSECQGGLRQPDGKRGMRLKDLLPTPTAQSYGTNQGGAAGPLDPPRPSLQTIAAASPSDSDPPAASGNASSAGRCPP